ncbi:MAG: class I SAM-dependent methyltransferase, partial [Candidatus Rokubacteria bacterium]|nr:class I SAM-dependent methyltransferase [Candidatus Rokubacteria bacterium]
MATIFDDYLYLAHRIDRGMAKRFCPDLSGTVLDVGCGRRPYHSLLANAARVIGMDRNPALRPDVIGSVLHIPVAGGAVNAVLCNEVLEHGPEPGFALAEMRRVLAPGGLVYATVPQSWGLHYEPHDYYRFTKYGISHLLEEGGFSVVRIEQMGGIFSFTAVRLIDFLVLVVLFPLLDRLGLRRGKYRLSALLVLPLSLAGWGISALLDRFDRTDAYGWAVLARK